MSTMTVQLPEDLDRELTSREISEARLNAFIVEAVKIWLRHRQARPAIPWSSAFRGGGAAFADQLIEDNQELFDELARL